MFPPRGLGLLGLPPLFLLVLIPTTCFIPGPLPHPRVLNVFSVLRPHAMSANCVIPSGDLVPVGVTSEPPQEQVGS